MVIYRDGKEIVLTSAELEQACKEVHTAKLLEEAKNCFCKLYHIQNMQEFDRLSFQDVYGFRPEDAIDPVSEHYMLSQFVDAYEVIDDTEVPGVETWAEAIGQVMDECIAKRKILVDALFAHIKETYALEMIAETVIKNCIAWAMGGSSSNYELQDMLKELLGGENGVDDSVLDRVVFE